MKNRKWRFLLILILSGVLFYFGTMPFRKLLSVFTVTEVRPVAVLNPFLGICFGLPSALGIMIANAIADAVSGYSAAVVLEGLIPQFLYTYIPYLLWKKLTAGEDHIHRLDSVERVLKYAAVVLCYALLSAVCVGLIITVNFGVRFFDGAFFVFLNNFDMGIILGCPLMIAANQIISRRSGTERVLSLDERIILCAGAAELIGLAVLVAVMYANNTTVGTYDLWNGIYLYAVSLINAIMLIALAMMFVLREKKE